MIKNSKNKIDYYSNNLMPSKGIISDDQYEGQIYEG